MIKINIKLLDVDCGNLNGLEHGFVVLLDNRTTFGGKVKYSCQPNFTLVGQEISTCGGDGNWTNEAPVCLLSLCGDPPSVIGGNFTISSQMVGGVATYKCQNGYILIGNEVSKV